VKHVRRELEVKKVASHFSSCEEAGSTQCASRAVSVIATSITTTHSSAAIASRMRALSASECAGFPLSTNNARKRCG
jgi:hypothetical protein